MIVSLFDRGAEALNDEVTSWKIKNACIDFILNRSTIKIHFFTLDQYRIKTLQNKCFLPLTFD